MRKKTVGKLIFIVPEFEVFLCKYNNDLRWNTMKDGQKINLLNIED